MGVLVFVLLFTGVLVLIPSSVTVLLFFAFVAAISAVGLLTLTLGSLLAERTPALSEAWRCCGMTAGAGALCALLTALLALFTLCSWLGALVCAALCSGFLALFLGGLLCFLDRYLTARFCCRS